MFYFPTRIAVFVALACMLGACESFQLTAPREDDKLKDADTEQKLVDGSQGIMDDYLDRADALSEERLYFDLPLIGAAAGAAGALLFGSGAPQTNILKGTGLGAGLVTTTRTYLGPTDRMNAYTRAADAVACIIDAGNALIAGEANKASIQNKKTAIDTALGNAKSFESPATGRTADDIAALKNAEAAATTARDALQLELDALDSDVQDTKAALRSIFTKIRTIVLTSKNIDFSSTRDALVQSAQQSANAAQKKSQVLSVMPTAGFAVLAAGAVPASIQDAIDALKQATLDANDGLKYDLAQAKAKLVACPASI